MPSPVWLHHTTLLLISPVVTVGQEYPGAAARRLFWGLGSCGSAMRAVPAICSALSGAGGARMGEGRAVVSCCFGRGLYSGAQQRQTRVSASLRGASGRQSLLNGLTWLVGVGTSAWDWGGRRWAHFCSNGCHQCPGLGSGGRSSSVFGSCLGRKHSV